MSEARGVEIDDRAVNRPTYSPVCMSCRHLHPTRRESCKAFPTEGGIPEEIWDGRHTHREAYPGDGGVQYEQLDDAGLVVP